MATSQLSSRTACALAACFAAFLFVAPAQAGTITLKSTQFSASKPVPHLHYAGTVLPGDLRIIVAAVRQYVDCDPKTLPDTRGNCAVLTMTSEGGNYVEGLEIARFLRTNAIATWVETGSSCYSACAFAFLGGSGYSFMPAAGAYIDRTIEPGATLGFHAPHVTADALGELVGQIGLDEVLGGDREAIALMVQELVAWNVDKSVLSRITNMGADDVFAASNAQDLYLLRVALPDTPRHFWAPDPAEALRNACMRLLAHYEGVSPFDIEDRLPRHMLDSFGVDEAGRALSGIQLAERPSALAISYCAVPTTEALLEDSADIALYYGPGIEGIPRPALTFFHRSEGWSTLTSGGKAALRIFQKGSINHFFMAPEQELGGATALTWRLAREDFLKTGRLSQ